MNHFTKAILAEIAYQAFEVGNDFLPMRVYFIGNYCLPTITCYWHEFFFSYFGSPSNIEGLSLLQYLLLQIKSEFSTAPTTSPRTLYERKKSRKTNL